MPLLNRKRILILLSIVVIGVVALSASTFFLSSSTKNDAPAPAKSTTLSQEELKKVKCQAGLKAPSVDSRACSFKEIAAAEIERRKLCNKEDARQALEIACTPGFSAPEGMQIAQSASDNPEPSSTPIFPNSTEPAVSPGESSQSAITAIGNPKPGEASLSANIGVGGPKPIISTSSAVATKCTPTTLMKSEKFVQNKSIACSTMMDYTAGEFFKDPRPGCKTKEEALLVVKRTCAGDLSDPLPASNSSALSSQPIDPANPLSNLINCTSIASSSAELVTKQPTLCSSPDTLAKDYPECIKEIIQVVTPACLGEGQKVGTSLAGVSTGNPAETVPGLNGECTAAAKSIETDPRVCQFKDLSAVELSNRNLCTTESAKTALDKLCTASGGAAANTTAKTLICEGAIIAKDAQFQAQKSLACGVGRSIAIKTIMERAGSPCKTEAETGRALDEACGKTSPSSSTPTSPSTPGTGGGSTSSAGQNCTEIANNLAGVLSNNRSLCSTADTVPAEYTSCKSEIIAKIAPICVGTQQSSTTTSGSVECTAFAESLYATVRTNTSLCGSSIPDQYKSCTETILATLKPLCGSATSATSTNAKCEGAIVAADSQFQQSKELACGVGKSVAIKTIMSRSGSPCKTESDAAKALDEACNLTTTPATGTPPQTTTQKVCNGALVASNADFIQNKSLACSNYKAVAIQKIMSTPGTPCLTEVAAKAALEQACSGNVTQTTSASASTTTQTTQSSPSPVSSTSTSSTNASPSPAASTGQASSSTAEPTQCTCAAIAANPEFQQNKTVACANRDIASDQIASKSGGACSKAAARAGLDKICSNQCAENPDPTTIVQTPNGPVPLFGIQGGGTTSTSNPVYESKCTCAAISANAEFQQNSGAACQFKDIAIPRIVSSSNGNCDTQTAAAELDKICNNQCVDTAGKKVEVAQTGSACTCANIAANPEFQQSNGQACSFKGIAAGKIVDASKGVCDENTAEAELDKICAGQCVGKDGNLIPAPAGGGGIFDTLLGAISDIPVIGDIVDMVGGGGGGIPGIGGGGGGFDFGGIIEEVKEHVGGFLGGFF